MPRVKGTFRVEDKSQEFLKQFEKCGIAFLNEAKDSLVSQTQRETPVKSGDLKRSFGTDSFVDESRLAAFIGSSLEYAIYVEKGTGEYAINGDGRKGGWVYKDDKGKLHYTEGMKPHLMLYKAYISKRKKISREAGKHYARLNNG